LQDLIETEKMILKAITSREERSISFEELVWELYSPNPTTIDLIVRALDDLSEQMRIAKYRTLFDGRMQNHYRLT
jgi:hypothetical protein